MIRFAVLLLALSGVSIADAGTVYKCVGQNGKVSFASIPCPTWEGDSTYQEAASNAGNASSGNDGATSVDRNLRAADIMRSKSGMTYHESSHLVIVPDSTSSMGLAKQKREAIAKAKAEKQARIAAGIEQPAPIIIIQQEPQYQPPPKTHFDCRASGYEDRNISCD
ncbi:DUF4124 domain-containing protein [Pseudomonas sp. GG8]